MTHPSPDNAPSNVLVVGFGAGGLATVEAMRREGFTGTLTVMSAESTLPYDRPPLSKQYLSGTVDASRIALATKDHLETLKVRALLGRSASRLDVDARTVLDDSGESHPFDALVIATGVRPRRIDGDQIAGVHQLRTAQDADTLREALKLGTRLVVVGGGFLGLEVASTATKIGCQVTVVEPTATPLENRIGSTAATRLLELHRRHGAQLLTGHGVGQLHSENGAVGVVLTTGETIEADAVLMAIGSRPNVEWLVSSGLTINDGVVCDDTCAAAPGIYAVGDVSRWLHRGLGERIRLEHRMNAGEQAVAVTKNILGHGQPFVPVPFFWTDQYDARIQVAGTRPDYAEVTVLTDPEQRDAYAEAWYVEGRLTGVLGWNAARMIMPLRRELLARAQEAVSSASDGVATSR